MITPSFSLTATERVLPRLALDFTTASLDPRVTFTRAGNTATVVNSSGLVAPINADLPRFDYDPLTLICKGLLIEESRTNIQRQSEDFNTTWSKSNTTVTTNTYVAPDGNTTADTVTATAANGNVNYLQSVTNGTTYAFSVFAKKIDSDTVRISFSNVADGPIFTFSSESFTTIPGSWTAQFEKFDNGWYRLMATRASNTTFAGMQIGIATSGQSVALWGAQMEAGAFATSYIPTVASQVTRTADVATMTGTNFSDWYNAPTGVLQSKTTSVAAASVVACASDGTANNAILTLSRAAAASGTTSRVLVGGVEQAGFTFTSSASNNAAIGYQANNFVGSNNGTTPLTDATGTIPTVNQLQIARLGATTYNCIIAKINYWPFRLTNAEVQAFSK